MATCTIISTCFLWESHDTKIELLGIVKILLLCGCYFVFAFRYGWIFDSFFEGSHPAKKKNHYLLVPAGITHARK